MHTIYVKMHVQCIEVVIPTNEQHKKVPTKGSFSILSDPQVSMQDAIATSRESLASYSVERG